MRDQIIYFPRLAVEGEEPVLFRRVEIWDKEKEEAIVFLSNLLAFGATTIAAIYKDRWEVETYASHCTSSTRLASRPSARLLSASFSPGLLTGACKPGCSYRQSPLLL